MGGVARFHTGDQVVELCGWAVFAMGGVLGLVSASIMALHGRGTPLPLDPASRLVVRGPYAHVRNPMAIGGLAQGVGIGLVFGSWGVLVYVATGALLWQMFVRRWEEADLLKRFGEPYARYRVEVPCWRPKRTPYRGERFTET